MLAPRQYSRHFPEQQHSRPNHPHAPRRMSLLILESDFGSHSLAYLPTIIPVEGDQLLLLCTVRRHPRESYAKMAIGIPIEDFSSSFFMLMV